MRLKGKVVNIHDKKSEIYFGNKIINYENYIINFFK